MLPSKLIKIYSFIVDPFSITVLLSKQKFYLIPLVFHEGFIEDTSYSLKPLGLLCAALGVVDKLGQRPLHLTA